MQRYLGRLRLLRVAPIAVAVSALSAASALAGDIEICRGGEPQAAIAACTRVIGQGGLAGHPLAEIFVVRSVAHRKSGDLDGAIADLTRAIEIDPTYANAYTKRGFIYGHRGDQDRAAADADKAIELDPKEGMAFAVRGRSFGQRGNYNRAIADFTSAIAIDPNNVWALFNRGAAFEKLGRIPEAVADYRRSVAAGAQRTDPISVNARKNAEGSLARLGNGAPAPGRRVALVIGVGDYTSWSKLNNPVHDARAISALLTAHGFDVIERTAPADVSFLGLSDAISDFERKASGAEMALVYYAGHGMQVGDKNILAPADMPDLCEDEHTKRSVDLNEVFRAVQHARAKVVLLDACRNSPFPRCPKKGDQSGSGFRALGRVDGTGLLIANATSPGALADDGIAGEGSPFARALIARIKANPRQDLRSMLPGVAGAVEAATRQAQTPEVTFRGEVPAMCIAGAECGP